MRLFPHIATKNTTLQPADIPDGGNAYDVLQSAGVGGLPARELFDERHAAGVETQFFVRYGDRTVGIASLCAHDPAGRNIRAEVHLDADGERHDIATEVNFLVVNYAFTMWNVTRVYFWVGDAQAHGATFTSGLYTKVASLPGHYLVDGAPADAHVFMVTREQWDRFGVGVLNRITETPDALID